MLSWFKSFFSSKTIAVTTSIPVDPTRTRLAAYTISLEIRALVYDASAEKARIAGQPHDMFSHRALAKLYRDTITELNDIVIKS